VEGSPRAWLLDLARMGMDLGLQSTTTLLDALHRPDERVPVVLHVAGSNGKGTVCALLAALAHAHGHRTLLFTSPHVARLEERVRINGRPVPAPRFDDAICVLQDAVEATGVTPTFFEATMLVAWILAVEEGVDVVVQETGLGGRLDATRATRADLAVVTSVTVEHASVLGHTRSEVMAEKAAIARPNAPLVLRDPCDDGVEAAARAAAHAAGPPSVLDVVRVPSGVDVREEARVVAAAAAKHLGWDPRPLVDLAARVRWPGRSHFISAERSGVGPLLLDAAHNPSGLLRVMPELLSGLKHHTGPSTWRLAFGCTEQDDLEGMLRPLLASLQPWPPDGIMLVAPEAGRRPGVEPARLATAAWPAPVRCFQSVQGMLGAMRSDPQPTLLVGSLYLVGNVLAHLNLDGDNDLDLLPSEG